MNELLIYDEIGVGDSTPKAVATALAGMSGDLTVRVNSPGGDAYAALAIMNTLRGYAGTVTVIVEGLAASAASYIAIGGAERTEIFSNAEIMIHDAMLMTQGNFDQLTKDAAQLNRISDTLAGIYATKAGGTKDQWRDLMKAETWFSAEEAVKAGLADAIHGVKAEQPATVFASALKEYRYAGRNNAPAPNLAVLATPSRKENIVSFLNRFARNDEDGTPPAAEAGPGFSPEQWDCLTAALKLDQAATLEEVVTAVEALAGATEKEIAAAANKITAQAKIDKTVVVDAAVWDKMQNDLKVGVVARTQAGRLHAEQVVDQAIRASKASPGQREQWIAAFIKDPEDTTRRLNKAQEIPFIERGYSKVNMDEQENKGWVR